MILVVKQYERELKEAQDALQFQSSMSAKEIDFWVTQEAKAKFKLKQYAKFRK